MSVRTSIRPQKVEIWYVGRGRWVMHDSMPYDPIQGQGPETFKVRNSSIFFNFQNLSPLAFLMWAGKWPLILKLRNNINFCTEQIFDICPSFCVTWLRAWNGVWNGVTLIQFANAFAIAITFARWRRRSEATAVTYGTYFLVSVSEI